MPGCGLTLGGGLGYLMGKHGAACDNLLSLDVVTAEGDTLTASAEQNSDLFWAMRGAGSNFGVVTSFRYRLHPLSPRTVPRIHHQRQRAMQRHRPQVSRMERHQRTRRITRCTVDALRLPI